MSFPGTRTYHPGVAFAAGNGQAQICCHTNWPFTDRYDSKAPHVPARADPALGCPVAGGGESFIHQQLHKIRPGFGADSTGGSRGTVEEQLCKGQGEHVPGCV